MITQSLRKLVPYVRNNFHLLLGSFLLGFPLALLRFSPVPLIKYMVDDLFIKKDATKLLLIPFAILLVFFLNFFVRFFHYYWQRKVLIQLHESLRKALYQKILSLSTETFTLKSTGTILSKIGSELVLIDQGITSLNALFREPITILALLGYITYLNWKLALITAITFPCFLWIYRVTAKNLKRYTTHMSDKNEELFSAIQESVTGIRVIKIFNLEQILWRKFRRKISEYTKFGLKMARIQEVASPSIEMSYAFALAGIVYVGGSFVLKNQMTLGDLVAFFTAFARLTQPIQILQEVGMKLQQSAVAIDRYFEVLNWPSAFQDSKEKENKKLEIEKKIHWNSVSFAYPDEPERRILNKISFEIPKNNILALVGESGAGKSSFVHLMTRLFEPTDGQILLDEKPFTELSPASIRNMIAVVSQDVFLFNDSIFENIRYGRWTATDTEIYHAADLAGAREFIESLPHGFETRVGDRGVRLSGGERQRISIARAFLKNAPLLILDEATSALDPATEQTIQKAIKTLMEKRTCVMIAHRLSTIQNADLVLVLKDGIIVERGTLSDLEKNSVEFKRLLSS